VGVFWRLADAVLLGISNGVRTNGFGNFCFWEGLVCGCCGVGTRQPPSVAMGNAWRCPWFLAALRASYLASKKGSEIQASASPGR
jgi:hypothetical protein